MNVSGIFTALVTGIVIGALGRLILPGRQAIGWILTFVVGLVGAFLGGFLAQGLTLDLWWHILLVQVAVAALLVGLINGAIRGQVTRRRGR